MPKQQIIFGSLETVSIPTLGLTTVVAKVDTGAWSGSLHCTDIREKDGVLYFTPLGRDELATSTSDFKIINVRSSNGIDCDRYLIPVTLTVKEKEYDTLLGLSDRTVMRREMLLGRRFLLKHNILVDVSLTQDQDDEEEIFDL